MSKKLSLLNMVTNFAEELSDFVQAGMPIVTLETYEKRLTACNTCEHLKRKRCTLCGCIVEYKAKWATTDCPDSTSRWKQDE